MYITATQLGKRFRGEWVFRGLTYTFAAGGAYALLGHNGAGKSTLLQVLSAHLSPSQGGVRFALTSDNTRPLDPERVYEYLTYTAPYVELIEEMTMLEAIAFQAKFKPFVGGLTPDAVFELLGLPTRNRTKEIRFCSSGMKQRLRLALGICADVPLLLLDEPTTNLDTQGVAWYTELLTHHRADRLLCIASNTPHDYDFLQPTELHITDYK